MNSFDARVSLKVIDKSYEIYSLKRAEQKGLAELNRLPFSLKVLLENLLRNENGNVVSKEDIKAVVSWLKTQTSDREIAFHPARVLMQDFTGVPAKSCINTAHYARWI